MRKPFLYALLAAVIISPVISRADYIDLVKKGNEAFNNQDYAKALEFYRQAEPELPLSPELAYNLGNGLYGQGEYEAALEQYTKALNSTDFKIAQKSHYNLGNTHFRMGDYQKAIGEFEQALKLDPTDLDAKYNLEVSRKMLKEQIKPQQGGEEDKKQQQQQQDQQQKQDQQNQQDQQQQQKQDEQQKDQQNSQDNQQSEGDQKDSTDQKQQQQKMKQGQQGQKMSKEDAERILNALKDDEQKIQQALKRARGEAVYTGKDW